VKHRLVVTAVLPCALATFAIAADVPQISAAADAAAASMVDIQTLVPDMQLEMRYASDTNFVGTRIEGYEAPRCYLLEPVAQALQRVEVSLREQGFRLRIFDCYRPVRAVQNFVRWAGDLNDQGTKTNHYPNLDKRQLLGDYIAPTSGHSRGATLDLTLMRCEAGGRCANLDMGTDFDFFDVRANTDSPAITPQQQENRQLLRGAMEKEGFRNYPMEWWHYTLQPEPAPNVAYDFPVK
jgi:zinc D-Ala-D-Ala dipeptidase